MSTYSTIHGTVVLDHEAAAAFRTSASWAWFEDRGLDDAGSAPLVVELRGEMYRNLCRYITTDLAAAQKYGNVDGTVTIDCSDGDNWRCVTLYSSRVRITGTGDCFHLPVPARPGVIVELIAPHGHFPGLDALVPTGESETTLVGMPTTCECGCCGWDDDDGPQCENRPAVQP